MKKNVGNADRVIRLLIAAAIAVLYFTNIITDTVGLVLLVLAGVFVLTSLVGFCPIYALLGVNTCPKKLRQEGE
jgi:Inner membrane protein YgaP-like, transmembrane domain